MNKLSVLKVLIVGTIILVLVAEATVLIYWARGTWSARIGTILQILAFYGIGLGFVTRSEILRDFGTVAEDMTSPDLFKFISGNLIFLSLLFGISSVGLNPRRSKSASLPLGCLGGLLLLFSAPLLFAYSIFHLLIIVPIAYLGYLVTSAVVDSIQHSSEDLKWSIKSANSTKQVTAKEIIAIDPIAVKSFLLGIPSAVLALVTRVVGLFIGD
ncbi:MAG TPA: hypothetical protein VNK49_00785 [Anaerolineales bacterium]|nr:hypothetical protein [Anaerolineales bacterium]